jgi:hypothetical protein
LKTTRGLWLLSGLLMAMQTACPIAPVEVDATVELKPDEVRYHARLRDVRVVTGGLVTSLPVFVGVATPPKELLEDVPWAGRPEAYRWVLSEAGVDLEMEGSLPRSVFDACAQAACTPGAAGACQHFPLKKCGSQYELIAVPAADAPGSVRVWPGDARVLSYRGTLTEEEVTRTGESARPAYELYAKDPVAAGDTVAWLKSFTDEFEHGHAKEARQLLERPAIDRAAHGPGKLERTIEEAVRRQRQHLLHAYLQARGYRTALEEPPPGPGLQWQSPYTALVPAQPLPEAEGLKLRVAYEVAHAGYLKTGELQDSLAIIREVCTGKRLRAASTRQFCELLLLGP